MKLGARGLTEVKSSDLQTLLKYVHRGETRCPLDVAELARCGLQHCAEPLLSHLRGLDANGVKAVVIAVIAERG